MAFERVESSAEGRVELMHKPPCDSGQELGDGKKEEKKNQSTKLKIKKK